MKPSNAVVNEHVLRCGAYLQLTQDQRNNLRVLLNTLFNNCAENGYTTLARVRLEANHMLDQLPLAKTGITAEATAQSFESFKKPAQKVKKTEVHFEGENPYELSYHLSKDKYMRLNFFLGTPYIHIRKYFEKDDFMHPTKKGIALTAQDLKKVIMAAPEILEEIAATAPH